MSRGLLPFTPESVLLVRLSARGDQVFASPLIRALRRTYPGAKITWMAESHTKDILEHHPELDEILVWDRARWKKLLKGLHLRTLFREARDMIRELRRRRFDVALDLQGLLRSGLMAYLSGASVRIGLGSKEGSQILMTEILSRHGSDISRVSSEYRYLAEELDLEVGDFAMEIPLAPEDQAWAREKARELEIQDGYLVAAPFTTRPQKHWFEDRWADLIDRARDELGLPTVLLGGPGDTPAMERIREMARAEPISLVGSTSLTQAGAMVEQASLVIGVDTGLSHMSLAFDRPTVTIFGSNIPYTNPPTNRGKVVVHWLECSPCKGNPTCNGDYPCLKLITVDQVLEAARDVLANEARKGAEPADPAEDGPPLPTSEPSP